MGWGNYHLYEFENKDFRIGEDDENFDLDFGGKTKKVISADSIKIKDVLQRKRSKIEYVYDFGKNWEHTISVENIFKDEDIIQPICLDGAMNCPPEDCSGVWRYTELIKNN